MLMVVVLPAPLAEEAENLASINLQAQIVHGLL